MPGVPTPSAGSPTGFAAPSPAHRNKKGCCPTARRRACLPGEPEKAPVPHVPQRGDIEAPGEEAYGDKRVGAIERVLGHLLPSGGGYL